MRKPVNRPSALVVEDVEWIRDGMSGDLRRLGYDVMTAADADRAVTLAERTRPALVLTEEEVPTFDDLMRRLHAHPSLARVPVVIINPDAEEDARYEDAYVLAGYDQLERLIASLPPAANGS